MSPKCTAAVQFSSTQRDATTYRTSAIFQNYIFPTINSHREGHSLREIADNLTVKVPLTVDGIKATKILSDEGIAVNVTLCFSSAQALLAAKAGATFISPFVGRLDDIGLEGMNLIQDIRLIYDNYGFDTEILTASARHVPHLLEAARLGSDVITAPPKVFWQLFEHPMTDKGLAAFLADWEKTGQKLG